MVTMQTEWAQGLAVRSSSSLVVLILRRSTLLGYYVWVTKSGAGTHISRKSIIYFWISVAWAVLRGRFHLLLSMLMQARTHDIVSNKSSLLSSQARSDSSFASWAFAPCVPCKCSTPSARPFMSTSPNSLLTLRHRTYARLVDGKNQNIIVQECICQPLLFEVLMRSPT